VLEGDRERIGVLRGEAIAWDLDDALQALVDAATAALNAPIGLVTLLLENSQFFRAHKGLPPPLARSRATDLSASLCQLAVRDRAPVAVENALGDPSVPQELIKGFGIRSYLGVPVQVDGVVVGTLCIADVVPRRFAQRDIDALSELAARATRRLQELAGPPLLPPRLLQTATAPVFCELRNVLTPLTMSIAALNLATAELRPLAEAAAAPGPGADEPHALEHLQDSGKSLETLQGLSSDLRATVPRLCAAIAALETVVDFPGASPSPLLAVVHAGLELARHTTKLVGDVTVSNVSDSASSTLPLAEAAAAFSSAASILAEQALEQAVRGDIQVTGSGNTLLFAIDGLPAPCYPATAAKLNRLWGDALGVCALAGDQGLELRFAPRH